MASGSEDQPSTDGPPGFGRENQTFRTREQGNLATAVAPDSPRLGVPVDEFVLWYVPVMQRIAPIEGDVEVAPPPAPTPAARQPGRRLSVAHARALYRPVQPVDADDDGYPYSDSSIVESQHHQRARTHLVEVVRARFADRVDVYAASELGLYFERGNRKALVVPDAFVAFGVVDHPNLSFKLWEHPAAPAFVLEVLSRRTWRKDVEDKPALYAALGVREYWLFDPNGVRRDGGAVLEGWRLDPDGAWQPVPRPPDTDGLVSEVLDLVVVVEAGQFRLRDRQSGELLPDLTEATRLREHEAGRANQEAARADQETARADREAARADEEAARADREAERSDAARNRVAKLEELLRQDPDRLRPD